jgi:hypothetical protein
VGSLCLINNGHSDEPLMRYRLDAFKLASAFSRSGAFVIMDIISDIEYEKTIALRQG